MEEETPKKRGRGRQLGSKNQATRSIKELAARHGADAISTLVKIMKFSKNEVNRKLAADSILDRAYGKPTQAVAGDPEMPIEVRVSWRSPTQSKTE